MYAFYYDQKQCRKGADALGAALAYTAYIEMGMTLIVILFFQGMGWTKNHKGRLKEGTDVAVDWNIEQRVDMRKLRLPWSRARVCRLRN
jgi:hypothetical protein